MSRKKQFFVIVAFRNKEYKFQSRSRVPCINDALAETRQGNERSSTWARRERERGINRGWENRIWYFRSFFIGSTCARENIGRRSTLFCVACETRISYLHGPGPRPPRVSTLDSTLEGERWWHRELGERRRKRGEREKCEMAAAAKISDRGRLGESCWRRSCKKAATELFNSRLVQNPSPAILPCPTLLFAGTILLRKFNFTLGGWEKRWRRARPSFVRQSELFSPLLFSYGRNAFNWPWPGSLKENLRRGPGRNEIGNEERCTDRRPRI